MDDTRVEHGIFCDPLLEEYNEEHGTAFEDWDEAKSNEDQYYETWRE